MSRRPRHVGVVSLSFPPVYAGGARQFLSLWPHLHAAGYTAEVFTLGTSGTSKSEEPLPGLRVYRMVPGAASTSRATYLSFCAWLVPILVARCRRAHLVLAYGTSAHAGMAVLTARILGLPSVVRAQNSEINSTSAGPWGLAARVMRHRVLPLANHFIALNSGLVDEFQGLGIPGSRISLIPNGVDTSVFRPRVPQGVGVERAISGRGPVAVFVGLANYRKGVDVLADAWSSVVRAVPGARLLIVGPTSASHELQPEFVRAIMAVLEREGVGRSVCFTGQVANVADYLRLADVFVLPSRNEGMPNALLEAMACGLPCIATRIPGVTDLVQEGETGLLVDCNDSRQLSAAIIQLFRDASLARRLGLNARSRVETGYDLRVVAKRYVDLFEGLLDERHRSDRRQ